MTSVKSDTSTIVKKAMDAWLTYWEAESDGADPHQLTDEITGRAEIRNSSTAMEMLFNYIEERRGIFQSRDFKLLAIEQPFAVPLDPERPDLLYIGRLDKVFQYQGRIYIGEHKTTTSYKKDGPFRSDFVDSFSPNSQVDGYLYAAHLLYGKKVKAVWIDAALVHANVHDGFRFIPVERQLQQLSGWLWETRYWIEQIEANKRALLTNELDIGAMEYMPAFPKNTTSCTNYGGCPYLDMCKMWSNPYEHDDPPGYNVQKWEPFDALEFEKANATIAGSKKSVRRTFDLYDNTRISAFRTCGRAYYFRHVRDFDPVATRRPLLFGGAWHSAMDVVWGEMTQR